MKGKTELPVPVPVRTPSDGDRGSGASASASGVGESFVVSDYGNGNFQKFRIVNDSTDSTDSNDNEQAGEQYRPASRSPIDSYSSTPLLTDGSAQREPAYPGQSVFAGIFGAAITTNGATLYIGDISHKQIFSLDVKTKQVVSIVGQKTVAPDPVDGIAAAARFVAPKQLLFSRWVADKPNSVLYVTDRYRIRRYEIETGMDWSFSLSV